MGNLSAPSLSAGPGPQSSEGAAGQPVPQAGGRGGAGRPLQVRLGETTHLPWPCQVQGAPPRPFAGSTPPL